MKLTTESTLEELAATFLEDLADDGAILAAVTRSLPDAASKG